jgi:hypothetical protein
MGFGDFGAIDEFDETGLAADGEVLYRAEGGDGQMFAICFC